MSDTGYLHSDPSSRREQLCGTLRGEGPQDQKQQARRPGDGTGLAALKNGVGVGMMSKGRMVDGTLSGKGRTLQTITRFSPSSKGQGKPLQSVRQNSDLIRCAFGEDHSGCTMEKASHACAAGKLREELSPPCRAPPPL